MSTTRLFWLRLITPGVIAYAYAAFPLLLHGLPLEWILAAPVGAGILLAIPYHAFNVRYRITDKAFLRVNGEIAELLVAPCGYTIVDGAPAIFQALRPTYYGLIDNDNSLSVLGHRIRANGYQWSTVADLVLITAIATAAYVPLGIVLGDYLLLAIGVALVPMAFVLLNSVYPRIIDNHMVKVREQITYMHARHMEELCESVAKLATRDSRLTAAT